MSAALLLVGLLAGAPVPEPPSAVDVTWLAPPHCPPREALLAGVAARRGRELEAGQVHAVARVTIVGPRRHRLELELDAGGRGDSRVLVARTCGALVDAAALIITLAVDGEQGRPGPPPPAGDEQTPEPAAPGPETAPAPPGPETAPEPAAPSGPLPRRPEPAPSRPAAGSDAPATPPWRRPGGFLRVHGLAEVGALPGPTGGVGLAGGLLWPRLRLELQATYLAPRAVERLQTAVRASLFAAAALGCVRVGDRRVFELPVCLGLEVGGIPGTADGPSGPRTALGRWAAATVGLGAAVRVHPRVALFALLQGLAAFQRGTFVLTAPSSDLVVFDPGVVSGRLALGVELRFGERG